MKMQIENNGIKVILESSEEVYNIKANFNHGFPTILKDNKIISAEVPLHIDIEIVV